ncbi:MAG: O-antigen ligase family protein, partial [Clostridiales bacterium]|nr:O-antigen ligase family protein [Clostridiales bacterium]
AVDVLWFWKTFALYIFFKMISSSENRRVGIVDALVPFAKLTIIFITLCSIVGIFADIGVAGENTVNGLYQFAFFWGNTIQTGWLIFSCLCLISDDKNERSFVRYLAIACIPAILSFSALVYCWFFVAVLLIIFLRGDKKIKLWNIVVLAIGTVAFLFADISEYLLSASIRSTFWKAAFQLANQYFPLGTGFASFGSDMAARYYSPIYVELGWSGTWGLGQESDYLNDNFFASILGQFGWIGFILYLVVLAIMFFYVNKHSNTKYERVSTVASALTIAAVMVGSASAKSMMGCCMFAVLGIIMGRENSSDSELEKVCEEGNN